MSFYAKKWAVPYLTPSIASVLLAKSPAHARMSCPYFPEYAPKQPSAAMEFGTLVDELVLNGAQNVTVIDETDYKKKATRDARDAAIAVGEIPTLTDDYERACVVAARICDKMSQNGVEIDDCSLRQRLFWTESGVDLSGEPDIVSIGYTPALIVDIKTTALVPTAGNWTRHVAAMSYDIQAAAYCERLATRDFFWCVAEVNPPYSVVLHRATPTLLASGQRRWNDAKRIWGECIASDNWPGPDDGEIDPAPWMTSDEITFTEEATDGERNDTRADPSVDRAEI